MGITIGLKRADRDLLSVGALFCWLLGICVRACVRACVRVWFLQLLCLLLLFFVWLVLSVILTIDSAGSAVGCSYGLLFVWLVPSVSLSKSLIP